MAKVYFNLLVLAVQVYFIGRAVWATQEAGPVAGLAFLLVAALFNVAKFKPEDSA